MIKFLPLFAKCTIQRVSGLYTLQSLNTRVDCVLILLVQFHHINDREGRGVCVSVVLKIYWSNFIKCSHLNMEVVKYWNTRARDPMTACYESLSA